MTASENAAAAPEEDAATEEDRREAKGLLEDLSRTDRPKGFVLDLRILFMSGTSLISWRSAIFF